MVTIQNTQRLRSRKTVFCQLSVLYWGNRCSGDCGFSTTDIVPIHFPTSDNANIGLILNSVCSSASLTIPAPIYLLVF